VLITNDPDEAILLATRHPAQRRPTATLGASIPVTISRPRHRKTLRDAAGFPAHPQELWRP